MHRAWPLVFWLTAVLSLAPASKTCADTPELASEAPLTPKDFAYGFVLPNQTTGVHEAALPSEVYILLTRPDRQDLAVFDAEGQLVPYKVYTPLPGEPERASRALTAFRLPNLGEGQESPQLAVHVRRDPSGAVVHVSATSASVPRHKPLEPSEWLLDLGDTKTEDASSLLLRWSESPRDFLGTLTLGASDDLVHWQPITSASVVQLRAEDKRVDSQAIPLQSLRARYLRVSLDSKVPPELALVGAELVSRGETPARPRSQLSLPAEHDARALTYRFRLPGPFPVSRARVEFAEDNTLVEGKLEAAADSDAPFVTRYVGALRRVDSNPERHWIALEPGDREFRLVLDDRGNARSSGVSLQVEYVPEHLQFLARTSSPHLLAIGSAQRAGTPVHQGLPVASGAEPLRIDATAQIELGGSARLSKAPAPPPATPWTRYGLIAALLLGTGLFAALAMKLLRDMRKTE